MSVRAAVPVGVYVTKHEAVPVVPGDSVQGDVANVPAPPVVKSTVPVGVVAVPIPDESVTVAVHVEGEPVLTDEGRHDTVVLVARTLTVTPVAFVLASWVASPL